MVSSTLWRMAPDRLLDGRPIDEKEKRRSLITERERHALRWIALGIILFFVVLIVGFVAANS